MLKLFRFGDPEWSRDGIERARVAVFLSHLMGRSAKPCRVVRGASLQLEPQVSATAYNRRRRGELSRQRLSQRFAGAGFRADEAMFASVQFHCFG
jgi:hypothetical protein